MVTWTGLETAAPGLAARVRERFDAHPYKTMATLRKDGSPRISGTEVRFVGGQMVVAGMHGSVKFRDLFRDPRVALHSGSDEPDAWRGDAKVAGRAVEVTEQAVVEEVARGAPPGPFHIVQIDLTEAVVVSLGEPADHLVIESWHEGRGVARVERR